MERTRTRLRTERSRLTVEKIDQLKAVYGHTLTAADAHRLVAR